MSCEVVNLPIQKKYIDTSVVKAIKPSKVSERRHYLHDLIKQKQEIPGPQKYSKFDEWTHKSNIKIKYSQRKNYLQHLPQIKNKTPGVGKYQISYNWDKIITSRNKKGTERDSFLDGVQFQSSRTPGVGEYNIVIPKKQMKVKARVNVDQRPLRRIKSQVIKDSLNPLPADYTTFESIKYQKKQKKQFNYYNKSQKRFRVVGLNTKLGPGVYKLDWDWSSKQRKRAKSWYDNISKGQVRSIYY